MPALHNRERDASGYRDPKDDEREISLRTGTILVIFFALALVCAVFFGLGYSMGRRSAQPPAIAAGGTVAPPVSTFSSFKPPAGSPAAQTVAGKRSPATGTPAGSAGEAQTAPAPAADPDGEIVTTPVSSAGDSAAAPRPAPGSRREAGPERAAAPIVRAAPPGAQAASPSQGQPAAMPAINPNGTAMVQVAAVSHQEDADLLIAALKKRGYNVFIRQEPQDRLLHVQIGPFATRKDADTMRQRLLSDGYNAIVK